MRLEYCDEGFYVDTESVGVINEEDGELEYAELDLPEDVNDELELLKDKTKELEEEVHELRISHGKLLRAIRNHLGFPHWPTFEGSFVDGVVGLLKELEAPTYPDIGGSDDI